MAGAAGAPERPEHCLVTPGEHCTVASCNQLDFLPVKCDACQKVFCKSHYTYAQHNCPEAYSRNNQVPVCPLCNAPVPLKAGEVPDAVVGLHIDNDCQSERAQTRRKVYNNRCSLKGCKQKEMVPLTCSKCRKNYCLKHRHEMDHRCTGFDGNGRAVSNSGAAAIARHGQTKETVTAPKKPASSSVAAAAAANTNRNAPVRVTAATVNALQAPGLSEEEALRQALALSLQDGSVPANSSVRSDDRLTQEQNDEALARALQESEREAQTVTRQTSAPKTTCRVS